MRSLSLRTIVPLGFLLLAVCSGCASMDGGAGAASPLDLVGLKPGRDVVVTSVEVVPPYRAHDVTVTGEVQLLTWDTVYLAEGGALSRAKIVAVHEKPPSLLHDVAMATLAGFAMHLAVNGLTTGLR